MLAAVSWDGGGGDLQWSNPLNWSNDLVPTSVDAATIDVAGTPTIELSTGVQSILSLVTNETIVVSGGSLTVSSNVMLNANLTNLGGSVSLSASTVNGPGVLTNSPGRSLTLNGATVNSTLVNQGTLQVSGASPTSFNGAFENQLGAELSFVSGDFPNLTIANGFTNHGQIVIANIDSFSRESVFAVTNGTLVNAATGTIETSVSNPSSNVRLELELDNQGTLSVVQRASLVKPNAQHSNSGTINVSSGTFTVQQSGVNASFANSGAIFVQPTAIFSLASGVFEQSGLLSGGIQLSGGTANLGADLSTSNILLTLTNSTMNGPGVLTNSPGRTLTLNGATVNSTLVNQGILTVTGAGGALNGTFENQLGAELSFVSGDFPNLTIANGFTNHGQIVIANIDSFSRESVFAVTNGTLVNAATGTIETSVSNPSSNVRLELELDNQGTLSVVQRASLVKPNAQHSNSGTINVGSGTFTVQQSGAIDSIANTGSILVAPNTALVIFSGLFNRGVLNIQGSLTSFNHAHFNETGVLIAAPTATLNFRGDFVGDTSSAARYAPDGTVSFSFTGVGYRQFEVMSEDRGPIAAGFNQNFSYGRIQLSNGANVSLVDLSDNHADTPTEAVYVEQLIIATGTTLDLNGLKIYARHVDIQGVILGGTVTLVPDGGTLQLGRFSSGEVAIANEIDEWTFFGRSGRNTTVLVNPGNAIAPAALSPTIGLALVEILAPSNAVIATVESTISGNPLVLENVPLPATGTYRVRVSAPLGNPTLTGHYTITAHDTTVTTTPLVLGRRYSGSLATIYDRNQWTFTAAAGQQVQFDLLGTTNNSFRFTLTGPSGYTGFSNLAADSGLVTLPEAGVYTLSATIPGGLAGEFSFKLNETTQIPLSLAMPYTGAIAGSGHAQLFKVTTTELTQLLLTLDDADGAHRNELYAKLGSPPTRGDFQYRTEGVASADHRLLVPNAVAGDWYILLYAESAPVASTFSMTAVDGGLAVDAFSPLTLGNAFDLVVAVQGAGFTSQTTVKLIDANDNEFVPTTTNVGLPTNLTARFPAFSLPIGVYSLRLEKPGNVPVTIPDAVTMISGGSPQLELNLVLPEVVGRAVVATIYVEFANSGSAPMLAPILVLHGSDNALLTLDRSKVTGRFVTGQSTPAGFSDTVQILGGGNTPGVLQPGEKISVPVYYAGLARPVDLLDTSVDFTLTSTTAENTDVIDWEAIKPGARPSDIPIEAWDAIWANVAAQTGSTWGDYVRMIADNARQLSELGRSVTDVGELLGFEIRQAVGLPILSQLGSVTDLSLPVPGDLALRFERTFLSSLSGRYREGPLGYGWTHNWQASLSVQADGTVVVTNSTGGQRHYLHAGQSFIGRYHSEPGDSTQLTSLAGGFNLTTLDGRITRFSSSGILEYVQDANGNRITAGYTGGLLTSLTHTSGASLTLAHDTEGKITSVTDSAGRQVDYAYDGDHLLSVTGYDDQTTQYGYGNSSSALTHHTLTLIADATGRTRFFDYDSSGRIASTYLNGNVNRVDLDYDSTGKVSIDNGAGVANLWFDHNLRVIKREDPLGITAFAEFCDCGSPTQLSDGTGNARKFTLSNGLPTSVTDELGNTTTFTYGPLATLTSAVDPKGNATRYQYDAKGNLTARTYVDGSTERYAYDAAGNVTSYTNRRGQTITYVYDALGQLTQKTLPGGIVTSFTYDARGNLTSITEPAGTTTYLYDPAERITRVTYPDGKFLDYAFDAAGRRTHVLDHTGAGTRYAYNAAGLLEFVRDEANALIAQYTYDTASRVTRKDLGNETYTTYVYDAAGNVTLTANHASDGTVSSQFGYGYDDLGRHVSQTTPEGAWAYTYDGKGQLSRAVFTSNDTNVLPHQDLHYVYDANGARIQTVTNGDVEAYTTNSLNQYTAVGAGTNTYDRDGNLLSSTNGGQTTLYGYDAENRLVSLTTPTDTWVYEYDALGNRIATILNGARTSFLVDPTGSQVVLAEFDELGAVSARYSYGRELTSQHTTGGNRYFNTDAQGSIIGLTDSSGATLGNYRYDPFGNSQLSTVSIPNAYQFAGSTGIATDGTGLALVGNRSYSTHWGGFLSVAGTRAAATNHYAASFTPFSSSCKKKSPIASKTDEETGAQIFIPECDDGEKCEEVESGAVIATHTTGSYLTGASPRTDPVAPTGAGGGTPGGSSPGVCNTNSGNAGTGATGAATPTGNGTSTKGSAGTVGSLDPNDKLAPSGYGEANFVAGNQTLNYTIRFENDAEATAPAQVVVITDQLPNDLDWNTLAIGAVGFGDVVIEAPSGSQHFETTVPFTYNDKTFDVEIEVSLLSDTGLLYAVFQSVDPTTQLPPDVLTGFLPPEDETGRGMGFVTFTIQADQGLPTGTEIRNIAVIQFDGGEIIATNQVDPHDPSEGTDPDKEALVTIDAAAPTSNVDILPLTSYPSFIVTWNGTDDGGGSGVASYDVYVSDNGGEFSLWLDDTPSTSSVFTGAVDHTYAFYSVARDNVGHTEVATAIADATTFTIAPPLPDYNSDNTVDAADYVVWRKLLGASVPLYTSADGSGNGSVEQADHDVWSAHFGETVSLPGGGSGAATFTMEELGVELGKASAPVPGQTVSAPVAAKAAATSTSELAMFETRAMRRNTATPPREQNTAFRSAKSANDSLLLALAIDRVSRMPRQEISVFDVRLSDDRSDNDSDLQCLTEDPLDLALAEWR